MTQLTTQTIEAPGSLDTFDTMATAEPSGAGPMSISDIIGQYSEAAPVAEASTEETVESVGEKTDETTEQKGGDSQTETHAKDTPYTHTKLITASSGDQKFEIPEGAVFKTKVDGKEEEVTVADLIKNYQGKIPLDKHYAESKEMRRALDAKEQQLTQERSEIESYVKDILDTFDKNPYLAFEKLAEWKGKNPADYLPVYIAQSRKTIEELDKLSEAEYRALLLARKNEHDKRALDRREAATKKTEETLATQAEIREADRYFEGLAQQHGFTETEVKMGMKIIGESGVDIKGLKPKEIADLLSGYILNTERRYSAIESVCEELNLETSVAGPLVAEIAKLVDSSFTKDDIRLIIKEYLKDSEPKSPKPKAEARTNNGSPDGAIKAEAKSEAPKVTQKEEKRDVGVGIMNAVDVGPMSIYDILSDYN